MHACLKCEQLTRLDSDKSREAMGGQFQNAAPDFSAVKQIGPNPQTAVLQTRRANAWHIL